METRKVTIISTRDNRRTVINTDATTLGELKSALRAANIDYTGMTFYEGLTKTELKVDSSLLPRDVQRVNPETNALETTNELAFMLTNTNKKIKSGVLTRAEIYEFIKEERLQEECVKRFGKNYTQCKTSELISLMGTKASEKESRSNRGSNAEKAILTLAEALYDYNSISKSDLRRVKSCFENDSKNDSNSPYSEEELDAMFEDML